MQNGSIERFNRQLRDEFLNDELLSTLADTCTQIVVWKEDYNRPRHHSTIQNILSEEFAIKKRR